MKTISLLSLLLMTSITAMAASFNCTNASTPLEKTICTNDSLNEADSQVGELYFSIRQKLSEYETSAFKQEQMEWLKARTVACKAMDSICLLNAYKQRIEILKNKNSDL